MLFTEDNKFHLHLISDSTGETLGAISRAVLSQFSEIESIDHMWTLVRTKGQMEKILNKIEKTGGMILYTIIDDELLNMLFDICKKMKIPCVSALDQVITEFSHHLSKEVMHKPGRQHKLDDEYFKKIEAINFTLNHDDGQMVSDIEKSDVIIVGPSRTSKSPTCVYLAYRGIKASNVPYVKGIAFPEKIFNLPNNKIIGLITSPESLVHIRSNRLRNLNKNLNDPYVDLDNIREELAEVRKIYARNKWPVLDVTKRSIEETSATIIQLLNK